MTIELRNVKPAYMSEEEVASSDIYLHACFSFEKGKKYLLKAASGHGKTSALNFIYGNNLNFNGSIAYIPKPPGCVFDLRLKHISYVFQHLNLFPELTVWENILLKNRLTHHKTSDEICRLINSVQLLHKKDQLVKELSLGQQQRIAIIRALCQPFDFLLLDEPFSHLDEGAAVTVAAIIRQELERSNSGLIVTSLGNNRFFDYDMILNL
ncbi:MAG: ATP-binding cassette domain-containing protein [Bacteroidales bacterium]|jgi:putative ABC transport system ATP-binding protein|nr:ATP-binding cassette domain-containing protein [Bacteroidales bacterium]